jgi:lipopolysaccharide/colanic/teichoic acid biosynthesis glycosyltransferase
MPMIMGRAMAVVGLVLLSPLIGILALVVRLSSPGPAFHRAKRIDRTVSSWSISCER